jgi:hypothetical protein
LEGANGKEAEMIKRRRRVFKQQPKRKERTQPSMAERYGTGGSGLSAASHATGRVVREDVVYVKKHGSRGREKRYFLRGHRFHSGTVAILDAFGKALAAGTIVEVVSVWTELVEVAAIYEDGSPSYHFRENAIRNQFVPTGTRCPMAKPTKQNMTEECGVC